MEPEVIFWTEWLDEDLKFWYLKKINIIFEQQSCFFKRKWLKKLQFLVDPFQKQTEFRLTSNFYYKVLLCADNERWVPCFIWLSSLPADF